MSKELLARFNEKALTSRKRSNSIATQLTSFLHTEITANKEVTEITAKQFNAEKIHVSTLYNAMKQNSLKISKAETYVSDNVDNYYITSAIVKLNVKA